MKLLAPLFLLISIILNGQELPPIQNYTPHEYRAENQNWSISQSKSRLIYVANNQGLLEYNSANWTLYPSPNETIMRSVRVVNEIIYTGCYMEFGYWTKADDGGLNYNSISKKFKSTLLEDEEFWNILEVGELLLFQSKKRIYIYDSAEDTLEFIEANTSLPKLWKIGEDIFFHTPGEGICYIKNGQKKMAYTAKPVVENEIVSMVDLDEGLLFLTRNQGFYQMVNGQMVQWKTAADTILSATTTYSALKLNDGKIAIGTISNGLILIDAEGELIHHTYMENGLLNNTVLSLFEDLDNSIWLGLDNGISHVDLNSPFLIYDDIIGDIGSVYCSLYVNGTFYVGTNQGLFYKKAASSELKLIEKTEGQVWDLQLYDNTILCGHHKGTFLVQDDRATLISSIPGTWTIKQLNGNQNLLLQGNYDGLHVLEKNNGEWKIRNKISGFENSSRFVEVLDNLIFVNHEYKGLFKLTVDKDLRTVKAFEVDTTLRGNNSGLVQFNDQLLFAYEKGVLKYQKENQAFVKDSLLSTIYSESEYTSGKMTSFKDELWFFTKENLLMVKTSGLSTRPKIRKVALGQSHRNSITGYENISRLNEKGIYHLGSGLGYIILNTQRLNDKNFSVIIDKVVNKNDQETNHEGIILDKTKKTTLENHQNDLFFSFYTPEYGKFTTTTYRHRLRGFYENWSDWSGDASINYQNLPYGDYTFEVQSRIGTRISDNTASYTFKISKTWYQTNLALVISCIVALMGFYFLHLTYKRHYKRKQEKLERRAEQEMQMTKTENEKEIIRLKNLQLKQSVQLKSSELAASTMSLLKKNEVLNEVKNMLNQQVLNESIKNPIINVIDKSLNQNDDWELFQEAFNNADKEFLGKLRSAHSNLTNNDIRLCAYLRLNLNSKEIARLFNISPRSVEVKRYRLRKKMDLEHDKNLVDYILDL